MHPIATYGLSLSPIRLAFQHNPYIPLCLLSTLLPEVVIPSLLIDLSLNMVGYNDLANVVAQMNNNITTNKDEKSNRALIEDYTVLY